MSDLSKQVKASVRSGRSLPAIVVDVFGNKASVKLVFNGSLMRNLSVVGGPVTVDQIVEVDFTTPTPTVVAPSEEYATLDEVKSLLEKSATVPGTSSFSWEIMTFYGGRLTGTYSGTSSGLAEALADISSGGRVVLPAINISGDFTVPAGVCLAGLGRSNTIINGTITLEETATIETLCVMGSVTGSTGDEATVNDCWIYNSAGSAITIPSGGTIRVYRSLVQGSEYSIDVSGTLYIYQSNVYGATDWFTGGGTISTYCVTEQAPDVLQVFEQNASVEDAGNDRLDTFHLPVVIGAPTTPTSYETVVDMRYAMSPIIFSGHMYYYNDYNATAIRLTRRNLDDDTEEHLLVETSPTAAVEHFAVMQDGTAIGYLNVWEETWQGWEFYKLDFGVPEETLLYRWSISYDDEFPHMSQPVVHNGKICAIIDHEPCDYSEWMTYHKFLIIDIESGEQLCTTDPYISVSDIEYSNLQYVWNPPVIVGNKVYFVRNGEGSWGYEPAIFVFDTDTNTVDVVRPKNGETIVYLYQQTYDPETEKIVYIAWNAAGDFSIMALDPDDNSYSFPYSGYSKNYPANGTDIPSFILASKDRVYIMEKDGDIFTLDDLVTPIRSIPPMTIYGFPLQFELGYPDNLCKWIDDNGMLWYIISNVLYAYPISGGDPINTGITIPAVPSGSWSRRTLFLTNQELVVVDVDRSYPLSNVIYRFTND